MLVMRLFVANCVYFIITMRVSWEASLPDASVQDTGHSAPLTTHTSQFRGYSHFLYTLKFTNHGRCRPTHHGEDDSSSPGDGIKWSIQSCMVLWRFSLGARRKSIRLFGSAEIWNTTSTVTPGPSRTTWSPSSTRLIWIRCVG